MVRKSPAIIQSPDKLQFLIKMDFYIQINIGLIYLTAYANVAPAFLAFIWFTPTVLVIYEYFWLFFRVLYCVFLLYFFRPTQRKETEKMNNEDLETSTFTVESTTSTTFSTDLSSNV